MCVNIGHFNTLCKNSTNLARVAFAFVLKTLKLILTFDNNAYLQIKRSTIL